MKPILISIVLVMTVGQYSQARDWRIVGNGGGGVANNSYLNPTLYEKFKKTDWISLNSKKLASLVDLKKTIENLHIPPYQKTGLLKAVEFKKYFFITKEDLPNDILKGIKQIYSNLWNIPEDRISLFALTTVDSEETLLLPEFFNLSINEQKTVLLHEALWTVCPELTYNQVIELESYFYKFLTQKTQMSEYRFILQLSKLIYGGNFLIQSVFLLSSNISLKEFLGPQMISCLTSTILGCNYTYGPLGLLGSALTAFKEMNIYLVEFKSPIRNVHINSNPVLDNQRYTDEQLDVIWNSKESIIGLFNQKSTCIQIYTNSEENITMFLAIYQASPITPKFDSTVCSEFAQYR